MQRTRKRLDLTKLMQLRDALTAAPMSYAQMAEFAGMEKDAMAWWGRKWHDEKLVYVADYGLDARGRRSVPLFAWGSLPDAQRPGCKQTAAERMRATRERRKKEGGSK